MRNRFSPGIEKAAKTPARLGNPYSSPCGSAQSSSASVSEGRTWRRLQAIERPPPRRIPAVRITRDMPRHGHTGLLDVAGAFAAAYLAGVSVICVLLQEWVRRRPRDLAQVVDL